jgi:glycosyltransferase involved in cell wall biosynthesis
MAKFMVEDYQIAMIVRDRRKADKWIYRIQIKSKSPKILIRLLGFVKRRLGIKTKSFQTDSKYCFIPNEDENIGFTSSEEILRHLNFIPEIVFSGMTDGFVNTSTLLDIKKQTGARIYQIMVDTSFITGGCHVTWECRNFINDCGNCPAITINDFKNYSADNFRIKYKNIIKGDFRLIVVPGWSEKISRSSILYNTRIKVITSSLIDTNVFTNINRSIAKNIFDLPLTSKVIFAGSNNVRDPRKGRAYLVDSLLQLWECMEDNEKNEVFILLAGNNNTEDDETQKIKFNKKLIEFINDDRLLSLAYQASDIFVNTSLEDAGPMMVAEALSCGTPVVGFKTGIMYENAIFKSDINKYHVSIGDSVELAKALKNVIDMKKDEFQRLSNNCRTLAETNFSKKAFLKCIEDF